MTALLVCLCGGLGAVARFVLNTSIQRWWSRAFPAVHVRDQRDRHVLRRRGRRGVCVHGGGAVHVSAVRHRVPGRVLHVLDRNQRGGVVGEERTVRDGRLVSAGHGGGADRVRGVGLDGRFAWPVNRRSGRCRAMGPAPRQRACPGFRRDPPPCRGRWLSRYVRAVKLVRICGRAVSCAIRFSGDGWCAAPDERIRSSASWSECAMWRGRPVCR